MISLKEKRILDDWVKAIAAIGGITSFSFLFIPELELKYKLIILISIAVIVFIIYIGIYLYYKNLNHLSLNINGNDVNIIFGNIFDQKGLKVIACNEYFDSLVDEKIISRKSVNGQLLTKYLSKKDFDSAIEENRTLKIEKVNESRAEGKKIKYKLGEVCKVQDYLLLAFSKYNERNNAELFTVDYAICLLSMWKNINILYNQEIINVALMGDGITRFIDNANISKQELLELMLWTLKTSMIKFSEPSKINIILYPGENFKNCSKFNFARIKNVFEN